MKMRLLCVAIVLLLSGLACVVTGGTNGTNTLTGCITTSQNVVDCTGVSAGVH